MEIRRALIARQFPKQPTYTQGIDWLDADQAAIVEASGLYGESRLRCFSLEDGIPLDGAPHHAFENDTFAEDVARIGEGRWIVLTWQEWVAIYVESSPLGQFSLKSVPYDCEGWGVAALDAFSCVTSDGSSTLTVRHITDLKSVREVRVTVEDHLVAGLNALAADLNAPSHVWANVFGVDVILRIAIATGECDLVVDCRHLRGGSPIGWEEMNGVAWSSARSSLLATGKMWDRVFELTPGERLDRNEATALVRLLPQTRSSLVGVSEVNRDMARVGQ